MPRSKRSTICTFTVFSATSANRTMTWLPFRRQVGPDPEAARHGLPETRRSGNGALFICYNGPMTFEPYAARTQEKMQDVIMDPAAQGPAIHYYMIRGGKDKRNVTVLET